MSIHRRPQSREKRMKISAIAIAAGFAAFVPGAQAADEVTWDLAIYGPPRAYSAGMEYIAKTVAEKTNGNFTIKLHYGESVSPAKEVLDSLKIGAIQIGRASCRERVCQYV